MDERMKFDLEMDPEGLARLLNGVKTPDEKVLQVYIKPSVDGDHFEIPRIGGEIKPGQTYYIGIHVVESAKRDDIKK